MKILSFLVLLAALAAAARASHPGQEAFAQSVAAEFGVDAGEVLRWLGEARYRQEIIDLINRPAESKPWHSYRPIFLNERRIADGAAFLARHRALLERTEERFGVPSELIVAILGVETSYGANLGRHRVLDALVTLGFYHPPRQAFFSRELKQLFALAAEQRLDLAALKGSYAGAMGYGQFMPSSYRSYAVDADGDGRIDLWNSMPDVFASVANYLARHGWQRGEPVAVPAEALAGARDPGPLRLEANRRAKDLAALGFRSPQVAEDDPRPLNLVRLEGEEGPEYWLAFPNFYVITRYNRSALYAMAVYQLAQAILERDRTAP
ncbi:MAG: murein transglycosylase [Lysobacterales bacterium]|nr:MAG: murein transglycosylase [Xanthomonadales bacterium]